MMEDREDKGQYMLPPPGYEQQPGGPAAGQKPVKPEDDPARCPHPTIGIKAERGCTDCWCLIVFAIFWAVMVFLAGIAFSRGQPSRLLWGTDYRGNVCGIDYPDVNMNETEWATRKLLWYPVTFDPVGRRFITTEAIDLGVCVATCPRSSDMSLTVYQGSNASADPTVWPILFNTKEQFYRCIPDFLTFNCGNVTECVNGLVSVAQSFPVTNRAMQLGEAMFREVLDGWWIIAAGFGISILITVIWVFLLRWTVKPVVVVIFILVLVTLIGLGVVAFIQRRSVMEANNGQDSDGARIWLAVAIILWIGAFLFLCVTIFLGKNILTACDIIEEAAKVPLAIPTMNAVPIVILACYIPFVAFLVTVAVFVQSCGSKLDLELTVPRFNTSLNFSDVASVVGGNGSAINELTVATTYSFEGWRTYAHIYNLFMFLWTVGLLNAIGYMIFALCGVFWYWSTPADSKTPPLGSVCSALKIVLRYHLGTLALGSFIVAVVQLMRILLVFIERKAKEAGVGNQEAVKCIFRALHCVLACLERVIKFINKNAYIVQAHNGKNFLNSAREGIELLGGNVLTSTAVHIIAEVFIFVGKFQIVLLSGAAAFALTQASGQADEGVSHGILIILIVALIAFLVATLFLFVLQACIDTILVCFCYDKVHSDVDYFPTDLAQYIDKSNDAKNATDNTKQLAQAQNMARAAGAPVPLAKDHSSGSLEDQL